MSTYNMIADLAEDGGFVRRCVAAAAGEGVTQSEAWGINNKYLLASAPGFGDAYEYAVASGVENPGASDAVITDAMILSAVQARIADQRASAPLY